MRFTKSEKLRALLSRSPLSIALGLVQRAAMIAVMTAVVILAPACSSDNAKSRYLLAEKLWQDGRYQASVAEFEKVIAKDPKGKLGLQALFRAAMTQAIYLNQHAEAVEKFRTYIEGAPGLENEASVWEARKQVGDILFTKLEQYEAVVQHYRTMLQLKPKDPEVPEFLFRMGKSQFYLWQFDESRASFDEIQRRFPKSAWAEEAAFQTGVIYFTRAGRGANPASANEAFQDAMDAFQAFIRKYPKSKRVPEAEFGVANCLEELDQLDAAFAQYQAVRLSYPSPRIVELKLARIRERQEQRSR